MLPTIICAQPDQAALVSSVLTEAAEWVASRGRALWRAEHVSLDAIATDVVAGAYFIAWHDGKAAGVVRLDADGLAGAGLRF
jgi:uncharacterized membrane protein